MKFKCLSIVIWITVSLFVNSCGSKTNEPTQTTTDLSSLEKEIALRLRTYEDLLKSGDSIGLGAMYTLDAEIIPSTVGRENIIKVFGGMIRDSVIGSFETIHLWGDDQLLVEEGKGSWLHKNGEVLGNGSYLLVWQKEDGVWKILRDTWFPEKK